MAFWIFVRQGSATPVLLLIEIATLDEEWKRHYSDFRRLDVPNTAKELQ